MNVQAPYYPEFAVNNTYGIKAVRLRPVHDAELATDDAIGQRNSLQLHEVRQLDAQRLSGLGCLLQADQPDLSVRLRHLHRGHEHVSRQCWYVLPQNNI